MENMSAMIVGSGKELKELKKCKEEEQDIEINKLELSKDQYLPSNAKEVGEDKESYKLLPHFPSRLRGTTYKVDEANQEVLESFRKVWINIPFLDAIK